MKALILLCLTTLSGALQAQRLDQIRSKFHQAVMHPEQSQLFHSFIRDLDQPTPTELAYQAVSEALVAQQVWNPISKFSQVLKYDRKIEEAVSLDSDNVEIRFLRLAIEYNLPSFLGISTHIEEDLKIIMENLESVKSIQVDPAYGRYIFYFLESTKLCSTEQILAMRQSMTQQSF